MADLGRFCKTGVDENAAHQAKLAQSRLTAPNLHWFWIAVPIRERRLPIIAFSWMASVPLCRSPGAYKVGVEQAVKELRLGLC